MLSKNMRQIDTPMVVGSGLVVLDIVLNNGDKKPVFSAGGTCGNVLAGLSYFGWQSRCVSRSGEDVAGELLIQDLSKNGVDVSLVTREKGLYTPRIVEKLTSDGQFAKHNFLLRCPSCGTYLPRFQSPRLDQITRIPSSGILPEAFFFDRVTPSTIKLAKYFRDNGSLVFFEPGKAKLGDLKSKEAIQVSHVVKIAGAEAPPEDRSRDRNFNAGEAERDVGGLVIKTLGRYGLLFRSGIDREWHYQPSYRAVELNDCCGAGDWCTIGFLFRLKQLADQENLTIVESIHHSGLVESALEFAQMLSALSCSFIGARGLSEAMSRDELLDVINSRFGASGASGFALTNKIRSTRFSENPSRQQFDDRVCPTCLLPRTSHNHVQES